MHNCLFQSRLALNRKFMNNLFNNCQLPMASLVECKENTTMTTKPEKSAKQDRISDIYWLIGFVCCWTLLVSFAIYSIALGNPRRYVNGYDSFGNICGQKNTQIKGISWSGLDMTKRPYVFHLDPKNLSRTMKVCVEKCAVRNITGIWDAYNYFKETGTILARYDFDLDEATDMDSTMQTMNTGAVKRLSDVSKGFGQLPRMPISEQVPIFSRCASIQHLSSTNSESILKVYKLLSESKSMIRTIVNDIYLSGSIILISALFCLMVSAIIALSLHYFASTRAFVVLSLAPLALFMSLFPLSNELSDDPIIQDGGRNMHLAITIILVLMTIFILIGTYLLRSQLELVFRLFKASGACFRSMPTLIIQPLGICLVLLAFYAFWTMVFFSITTLEHEVKFNLTTTRFQLNLPAKRIVDYNEGNVKFAKVADQYQLESIKREQSFIGSILSCLGLVMLVWSTEFILGCQQMIVSLCVVRWYYSRDRSDFSYPIFYSIHRTVSYHLGSIALASFLLMLYKIPIALLNVLRFMQQSISNKFGSYIFGLFEKLHDYMNYNAYTIMAIHGPKRYWPAIKAAVRSLRRNKMRIFAIKTIGDVLILFGLYIATVLAATLAAYLIINDPAIHSKEITIGIAMLISYMVASSILSIYKLVVDSMFLCLIEDVEQNANTPEGLFAPDVLCELVLHNKRGFLSRDLKQASKEESFSKQYHGTLTNSNQIVEIV